MNRLLKLVVMIVFLFPLAACQTPDESDVTIVLNEGVDTVEINSDFIDAGATSTAYGLSVDNEVIYNDVDITTIGTYRITYSVEYKTVTKTITRIVTVVDETAPTGYLNAGIDTVQIGTEWIDASVTASDNSLGVVTISVSGTVNGNIAGEYIITYLLEDPSGNQTTLVRYVVVTE